MIQPTIHRRVHALATLAVIVVLAACGATSTADPDRWDDLPAFPNPALLDTLSPTWDNQITAVPDVRVYVEPYCQTKDCEQYVAELAPYLASLENAHVRIYDYPLSREIESLMVSGIGICIAAESPSGYLVYLREAAASRSISDELEMVRISKLIYGKYDSSCLHKEMRRLQPIFENDNPLGLESVPATVIDGRIVQGAPSMERLNALLESIQ